MAKIVISIAAKVAELLVNPIRRQICYMVKYQSNMEELKKQVQKLTIERESLQHSVDEAKRQGDEIVTSVEEWMNKVDEFAEKVVKPITDDEDKAKKLCSIGFCSNLMTRYSLSKKAVKTTKNGIDLVQEGKFQKISYRPLLQRTASTYVRGYGDFDSRKPILDDLMKALRDADVNLIGVYGMGGVGKTTLVKRVVAQAIEDNLFDVVVMVDVTQTPDIKNIQAQIADELGLKFEEESLSGRAARLRHRLKKEKKVLLVLDDIWRKLDLETVGIPLVEEKISDLQEDLEEKNETQRQCKLLLTSRREDVLSNDMNTEKNFLVKILSHEEAGNLFWKTVGDSAKTPDLDRIGVEIVRYCAGLPIAIATIASALKNKTLFEWKDASEQLRRANPRHIQGMDENVYSAIKLSYDFLQSKEAKSLFLLCSLRNASSGIDIDYLLRYGMGLSLFQGVSTLEQGRNRLHMLVNNLKASSLLLDGYSDQSVKMHDVIHDFAISIASTDELMFNIPDVTDIKEWLEDKLPKDSSAISLLHKDVRVLPERLECPKLKLLILFEEDTSLQIPDSFFEGMKELQVLHLDGIHMLSSRSSLCRLTNLQTLCFNRCQLGDISIIRELKRLEILSFRGSDIEQLPGDIRQLTRLRLLDLKYCSKLKAISPNILSSLTRLEELYIGDSFAHWEVEGRSNASLAELKQLSRLTTLEIHILDAQVMPQDLLIFEKLERFAISIGYARVWFGIYNPLRTLKLKLNNSICLGSGMKMLLNRTEDLYLDELKGVKNVLYQLNGEGFPQLKHLHVRNGPEIQYIVDSIEKGLFNFFPKLESLFIHNLINLDKLCHGQLATESFNKLRILNIGKCDRLKHLFSFSMAQNLLQLQEIVVTDCKKLEEIILKESEERLQQNDNIRRIEFTQLRTLRLQCLPQLTSFGFKEFTPDTESHEIIAADKLGGFMPSFSQTVFLPILENLNLSSINIECMWLDQLPAKSSCCQTLKSLTLENCSGNLKFVFSYSVIESLVLLEKLEIRNCKLIEGIIYAEELRGERKVIKMVFPKLIYLQLKGLPNLTQIGLGNSVEFPSLTRLSIEDCPKLKKEVEEMNCRDDILPLFNEKVVLSTLAFLNLSSICIQTIWHNQFQPKSLSFQNLTEIIIDDCDNLKYIFPFSMVESLIKLRVLRISNCKLLEVITITAGEVISNTMFPKLYNLNLKHLPELTSFCKLEGNSIELPSLAELWLENCPKMHTFVSNSPYTDKPASEEEQMISEENLHSYVQPLFDEKVVLSTLASLNLSCIPQIIWNIQLQPVSSSFQNLTTIIIDDCDALQYLFSPFMVKNLIKLEVLQISNCKFMEEVIVTAGENICSTLFPKLNRLNLQHLPELTTFCYFAGDSIELPSLDQLSIEDCPKMNTFVSNSPNADKATSRHGQKNSEVNLRSQIQPLFDEKVVLPNLASFNLSSIRIQTIWHNQLQPTYSSFQNLIKIIMDGCGNLKYVFSSSMVESLIKLEVLQISNCNFMEEVIITAGERICNILFPKLNQLHLKHLPEITAFCKVAGNSIELLSLAQLSIENCPKMRTFVSNSPNADIPARKDKQINSKEDLHLHLQPLFDEKVVLHTLASLNMSSIPIQTIWHNQLQPMSSSFQNLIKIIMDGCDNLKYVFSSSMVESLIKLEVLQISNCNFMEDVIISNAGERICNTLFPKLNRLHLKNLPALTSFCKFIRQSIELPSLADLWLENCPKMHTFVSSSPNADKPTSEDERMDSKENLHSHIQPLFDEKVQLPSLEILKIGKMESMRKLWHYQLTLDSFYKLKIFWVYGCHNLLNVFPSNILGRLQKLKTLMATNCNSLEVIFEELDKSSCMLEEIVAKEEDIEAVSKLVLTQLTLLKLQNLPRLRIFCPGLYISQWPMLKTLRMRGCKRVQRLTSEFQSIQETYRESQHENVSIEQPLFILDKVAFPNLEEFSLEWNFIVKEMLNGKFSGYSSKINDVELIDARKETAICPCVFLYTLPNLEKLSVTKGVLEEMFICEGLGCEEKYGVAPSKLDHLSLKGLDDSLNLWEENSLLCKVFQNLTTLEISTCGKLRALVSSFVSFENLKTLEISKCSELLNLMTVSTAKSLVQLTRLKMSECERIEEIIIHGGEQEENLIIFDKLKYLELHCLPRLTSFYSGSCAIEFPSLQQVVVRQCPNMKYFLQGTLSTPSLYKLQTEEAKKGIWEGSLNTTIQNLFKDMVGFRNLENFTISNFPQLKELWHKQFLVSYFSNLKSLVVDDKCCSLRYIFTPSVALGLVQLQKLEIKNCAILEAIIIIEEETKQDTLFPNLKKLELKDLPELTSFCNFCVNPIDLPSLATLRIENCPNMETFISNSTGADMPASKDNLHTDIQPLFDEKLRLPNLKFLRLDKMDKLRKIWHHQLTSDSFCKLASFGVHNCHNVSNVFPSNMFGRVQKLEELRIRNCSSLEEIFELQVSGYGNTKVTIATQLRKLVFEDLPKLKHIWDTDSQGHLTCQNLLSIQVEGCDSLKSIFPASVGRNLLQLEELFVSKCCMVEEIFAKEEEIDEAMPRFPQLTFLRLRKLSRLRSFYPRVHISEWPMLKKLQVWSCDKVELSASKFLSFQVINGESQQEMSMEQPQLLLDKVPFANLETLGLDWKWIEKEALHEKLPEYSCKLKHLTFKGFQKAADICVFCFLHKLPNLETLQVFGGFFKEVFSCEGLGCEEKHVEVPSKLSRLRLVELCDSLHLWEESSLSRKVFQDLANLEVIDCDNLKSLVPSSISFQNLKALRVSGCNELLNLVTVLIAKSLMQLTKLSISDCTMIEEIITHEGDEMQDQIIFEKLRYLKLDSLPSLTSFYSGNYSTEFPSLQRVTVRQCPKMKIFSRGVLSTPRLHRLETTAAEGIGFWEGDLNTTMEHLIIEVTNNFTSLTSLGIYDDTDGECFQLEKDMTLPHTLTHLRIGGFRKLENLAFKDSEDLSSLKELAIFNCHELTSLPSLPSSLWHFDIYDCPLLKEWCKRDKGKEWSKIADIPHVEIRDKREKGKE